MEETSHKRSLSGISAISTSDVEAQPYVEPEQKAIRQDTNISQHSPAIERILTADGELPEIAKGKIIVDWDGPDDPANPKNWKLWKKLMTTIIITLCTTSLYMGAAIITPAMEQTQKHFHTSRVKNALGLSMFIYGYGVGSLWFSPMSEIPLFRGRTPIYLVCQLIFACLQIPTGLVNHIAPFAVLRALAGIFASPPLSTAGATLGDIWDMPFLGLALISWAFGSICGPFVGPLVGAALVQHNGWRYIFWFMLAISGGFFFIMLFFLPETSAQELLIRKARKLRKETGNQDYIAPGEILMSQQTTSDILKQMFFKPLKITIMEPVVLFMNLHIGLLYSVVYLFMEAFPIVYLEMRHWNLVEMGLAFMPFVIGICIGAFCFTFYLFKNANRLEHFEKVFGPSAVFGAVLYPAGLLIWGWLQRADIHWAIGMIGNILNSFATFFMFQSYFSMLGIMFPPSAAGSAFASNNMARSLMAGSFPLFGTVFYNRTATERYPVGWGCSILALGAIVMIPLPVYLTIKGGELREYAQRKYGNKRFE